MKKKGNGVYAFVLSGDISIDGNELNVRDGIGIWDTENISFKINTDSEVLLMEVPMGD